jgi:hypothetical protein
VRGDVATCFGLLCALTALPFFSWFCRAATGAPAPSTLRLVAALFLAAVPWFVVIPFWVQKSAHG